jgi:general secretion pathway protein K
MKKLLYKFIEWYNRRKEILNREGLVKYISSTGGYILIIVLITITLLVTLSTEFIILAQTNIGYIKKFDARVKALFLARSGFELSKYILQADKSGVNLQALTGKATDKNIDSYNDLWAVDFPSIPIEDGSVKITISDENSKINLSVLANEVVDKTPYYSITQRFFMNMGLPMDLADIIIDWVDIDDSRFPYGVESEYYQTLIPPYNSKNASMDSIDELLLLKDFTPEIFYGLGGGNIGMETGLVNDNKGITSLDMSKISEMADKGTAAREISSPAAGTDDRSLTTIPVGKESSRKLSDYFRVYGSRDDYLNDFNKININTASYRVLSALTDYMTDDIVAELIRKRMENPYRSMDQVKELIPDDTIRNNILTVRSHIFKIIVSVEVARSSAVLTVYFNRDNNQILYWLEE